MYTFTTLMYWKTFWILIQKVLLFLLFSCTISFLSVTYLEQALNAFYEWDLLFPIFILTHTFTELSLINFDIDVWNNSLFYSMGFLRPPHTPHTSIDDCTYSIKMRFLHWIFYFMKNLKLMISVKPLLKENKEYGEFLFPYSSPLICGSFFLYFSFSAPPRI